MKRISAILCVLALLTVLIFASGCNSKESNKVYNTADDNTKLGDQAPIEGDADSIDNVNSAQVGNNIQNSIIVARQFHASKSPNQIIVSGIDPDTGVENFNAVFHAGKPEMGIYSCLYERGDFVNETSKNPFNKDYSHFVKAGDKGLELIDKEGSSKTIYGASGDGFEDSVECKEAFFTRDQSKIVFSTFSFPGKPTITDHSDHDKYWCTINEDGSDLKLICQLNWDNKFPAVSSDASKYYIFQKERDVSFDFYRQKLFSRTGKLVVDRMHRTKYDGSFRVNSDTMTRIVDYKTKKELSSSSFDNTTIPVFYDWAPDDSAVLAEGFEDGDDSQYYLDSRSNIYKIPVSNSGQLGKIIALTSTTDRSNFSPVFSPDGTKIAFISNNDEDNCFELWTMNHDGSNKKLLYGGLEYSVSSAEWDLPRILEWTQ